MNESSETEKFLVKNIVNNLLDFGVSNEFLNLPLNKKAEKEKINKWDFNKLKSFFVAKKVINGIKMRPTECEIIFATIYMIRG